MASLPDCTDIHTGDSEINNKQPPKLPAQSPENEEIVSKPEEELKKEDIEKAG
jgi:hypothetical protein